MTTYAIQLQRAYITFRALGHDELANLVAEMLRNEVGGEAAS